MQKIINVLALASSVVSLAVVGTVGYVYVQRDAIIEDIKEKAMESVLGGGLGGVAGGAAGLGVDALPLGSNDLSPQTNPDAVQQAALPEAPIKF